MTDLLTLYQSEYESYYRQPGEYTLTELSEKLNIPHNSIKHRIDADIKAGRVTARRAVTNRHMSIVYRVIMDGDNR